MFAWKYTRASIGAQRCVCVDDREGDSINILIGSHKSHTWGNKNTGEMNTSTGNKVSKYQVRLFN